MEYTRDTRIIDLTLGQFEDWMRTMGFQPTNGAGETEKRWVYGVAGVMALFGCSRSAAMNRIHGVIAPACVWIGPRTLKVDADLATQLIKERKFNQ